MIFFFLETGRKLLVGLLVKQFMNKNPSSVLIMLWVFFWWLFFYVQCWQSLITFPWRKCKTSCSEDVGFQQFILINGAWKGQEIPWKPSEVIALPRIGLTTWKQLARGWARRRPRPKGQTSESWMGVPTPSAQSARTREGKRGILWVATSESRSAGADLENWDFGLKMFESCCFSKFRHRMVHLWEWLTTRVMFSGR